VNAERLRTALLEEPVPDAREAEERGWRVARAARGEQLAAPRGGAWRRRALELALAAAVIAVMISPAGAAVRDWVGDAVRSEQPPSRPALTSLPAPGSLLVDSARGPWIVRADGSRRLLGPYLQSTWSAHGLFVAATTPHQLLAIDPQGEIRWALARRGRVRDPAWSPDGYRIAYLDGYRLRVVGADGLGDRLLAAGVAGVAPAWAPGHRLSFVDGAGRLRTVQADRRQALWSVPAPPAASSLAWSRDGTRLLAVGPTRIELHGARGELLWRRSPPRGTRFSAAAPSPGGDVAAIVTAAAGASSKLLLLGAGRPPRLLFAGLGQLTQVTYSPDGRWLLVAWRSADQWLFLSPRRPGGTVAIAQIAAQFDPATTSPPGFPRLAGWCCPAAPVGG
jgi:hypothetical protein